ncbi:MAG: pyridoxamine 5'-phosphate oxidase family protein [Ignavibacteriae bacterium]|nr:pyridoxamine 5'-phosphate oxidase family protein [Ignavibacteriota bacterium]
MDSEAKQILTRLIREQQTAALGTLRSGAPEVSMVVFAAAGDFSSFYLHVSKLAHHTQNLKHDPRASLMIAESPEANRNPQSLARVSIQGEARLVERTSDDYDRIRSSYLSKFPQAEMMFGLGDFSLYEVEPKSARFVAGFAQTYNLTLKDFRDLNDAQSP